MNERAAIDRIRVAYRIPEGSRPHQITPEQLRGCYLMGRLLLHAHRRGKRRMGRWVTPASSTAQHTQASVPASHPQQPTPPSGSCIC